MTSAQAEYVTSSNIASLLVIKTSCDGSTNMSIQDKSGVTSSLHALQKVPCCAVKMLMLLPLPSALSGHMWTIYCKG